DVDAVAISSFPQQKIEETPLDANRQISYDNIQSVSAIPDIKHENKQHRAWIKNIKTVLQNIQKPGVKKISDYKDEWESSIESILKNLSIENDHLIEECKKKNEKIRSLEELLREIEEENVEIIDAIDTLSQLVEVPEEVIKRYPFSSSTETIVPEETSAKYARRISKESGYSSEESIYSSTETIVPEKSDAVFVQANTQITELEKKNTAYKEWVNSLEKKLDSNLTLNFIKRSKPELKILEDLKAPSFKNVELKQENKETEEILQSLEAELEELEQENAEIHALYQKGLLEGIYQFQLDNLEKSLRNEQRKLKRVGNRLKKLKTLDRGKYYTICF
ncbi:MAG: hypothetical protein AABZ92_05920, partial [Verrucomicrobiota bacterium]